MRSAIFYPGVEIPQTVEVNGENLVYEFKRPDPEYRRLTDRALLEFARLSDATPREICEYARRHGVLEAFRVNPRYGSSVDLVLRDKTIWRFGEVSPGLRFYTKAPSEPLALWRLLALQVRSILRINAALKGRRSRNPLPTLSPEDWEALAPGGAPLEDVRDEQFFLNMVVNHWLLMGGVRLELMIAGYSRSATNWNLEIAYSGLVGALAYRMLLVIVGEDRLYVCAGCGTPYVRDFRAPRPGQENFCPDCTEISKRRAIERYRQKQRKRGIR